MIFTTQNNYIYMLILELVFAPDRMFLKRLKMGMSSISLTGCRG